MLLRYLNGSLIMFDVQIDYTLNLTEVVSTEYLVLSDMQTVYLRRDKKRKIAKGTSSGSDKKATHAFSSLHSGLSNSFVETAFVENPFVETSFVGARAHHSSPRCRMMIIPRSRHPMSS